jgi:hypothetical protein
MDILPVEAILETEAALLEANRTCELAETRFAEVEALLEQMRAERDYWRDQARQLEDDRDYWREQTRRLLPRRKRTIATEWSSQRSFLGSLS